MDICRSFWDQSKNGYDGINSSTLYVKLPLHWPVSAAAFSVQWLSLALPMSCLYDSPSLTLPLYQPRGHQQSSLSMYSTVCFIKSLNSRTLRPPASHWQVTSAVELSGASESWVSLADDAHGWMKLLTVPDTDRKAICHQSVSLSVCVRACTFNSSQLTSSFQSFLSEDVELF